MGQQEFRRPPGDEYLLVLNSMDKSITISAFRREHLALLEEEYLQLEKGGNPDLQVVQVSVEDVTALRTAYPNYYLDTQAFVLPSIQPSRRRDSAPSRRALSYLPSATATRAPANGCVPATAPNSTNSSTVTLNSR